VVEPLDVFDAEPNQGTDEEAEDAPDTARDHLGPKKKKKKKKGKKKAAPKRKKVLAVDEQDLAAFENGPTNINMLDPHYAYSL